MRASVLRKWFCPNKIGYVKSGTTRIVNVDRWPFSQTIGTCIVPTALRDELGPATETGIGCSNLVNWKFGLNLATVSAWFLLTSETEQQLSKGKGKETPAEVTLVQKIFLSTRFKSEILGSEGTGVMAGMPKSESCDVATFGATWEGWGSCRLTSFSILVV